MILKLMKMYLKHHKEMMTMFVDIYVGGFRSIFINNSIMSCRRLSVCKLRDF